MPEYKRCSQHNPTPQHHSHINGNRSQYAFELGLPYDPANTTIEAGTTLHAVVEYVIFPNNISDYYGD